MSTLGKFKQISADDDEDDKFQRVEMMNGPNKISENEEDVLPAYFTEQY